MNFYEKIDYSALSTYLTCPRRFLFQYVMNLKPAGQSIHLVFGSCWHYGLEATYNILIKDSSPSVLDATETSIKAFHKLWKLDGEPFWKNEDAIFPKSPGHAANMYKGYWDRFLVSDVKNRSILAVEAPFSIDLSTKGTKLPNYIGRIDLIFSSGENGIDILDHKTAKAIYSTTPQTFEMSFQSDGYLTAGRIFYDKIPTITYRVALCQKSKIDFVPITINKRSAAIEHFLSDLCHYADEIQQNLNLLEEDKINCRERSDVLQSFHRNPGYACTTFSSVCPYYDLCRLRNNPLHWMEKAPQGFIHSEWDPDKHEANTKQRLSEV